MRQSFVNTKAAHFYPSILKAEEKVITHPDPKGLESSSNGSLKGLLKAHILSKICIHNFTFNSRIYPDLLKWKLYFFYLLNNLPFLLLSPACSTSSRKNRYSRKVWHFYLGSPVVLEFCPNTLFKWHGETVLFRFSCSYLIFWWASLCILLSLEYLALAVWVPLTPYSGSRISECLPSSCSTHQPQPAGSNWTDQTTACWALHSKLNPYYLCSLLSDWLTPCLLGACPPLPAQNPWPCLWALARLSRCPKPSSLLPVPISTHSRHILLSLESELCSSS